MCRCFRSPSFVNHQSLASCRISRTKDQSLRLMLFAFSDDCLRDRFEDYSLSKRMKSKSKKNPFENMTTMMVQVYALLWVASLTEAISFSSRIQFRYCPRTCSRWCALFIRKVILMEFFERESYRRVDELWMKGRRRVCLWLESNLLAVRWKRLRILLRSPQERRGKKEKNGSSGYRKIQQKIHSTQIWHWLNQICILVSKKWLLATDGIQRDGNTRLTIEFDMEIMRKPTFLPCNWMQAENYETQPEPIARYYLNRQSFFEE